MKVVINQFEIEVETDDSVSNILDLKLGDLLKAGVHIRASATSPSVAPRAPLPSTPKPKAPSDDIGLLLRSGFTTSVLAMISAKVFGAKTGTRTFPDQYGEISLSANQFLTKEITEDIWALYMAPVNLPIWGQQVAALGLSKKNQLIVLGMQAGPIKPFIQALVRRGLRPKDIKLGVLSFHLEADKQFKEAFPQAQVALDWMEYVDLTAGVSAKAKIKAAINSKDAKEIKDVVKEVGGPKELATFLSFPKALWRPLRSTAPIKRIEKDLKSKFRLKAIETEEQRNLIANWALIRLQYQWLRVPVDADQLSHLKYIHQNQTTY